MSNTFFQGVGEILGDFSRPACPPLVMDLERSTANCIRFRKIDIDIFRFTSSSVFRRPYSKLHLWFWKARATCHSDESKMSDPDDFPLSGSCSKIYHWCHWLFTASSDFSLQSNDFCEVCVRRSSVVMFLTFKALFICKQLITQIVVWRFEPT